LVGAIRIKSLEEKPRALLVEQLALCLKEVCSERELHTIANAHSGKCDVLLV
jgi:hypothetical protein